MAPSRFYLSFLRRFSTAAVTTASSAPITISKAKLKLRKIHDPDKALAIYNSVSKNPSSPLSSRYAMELTVQRLAKSQRFSDIEALIESHKNSPKIKTETFLSTLIRSYGRASMFDHAMKTFEEMDQLGTPRSVVSFNALLAACLHSDLFERVPQLFDEIPQRYNSITPDKISYGMLIKSYCDSGSPEKAMEIMRDMEVKDVEVTIIAFTTILGSLYKNGLVDAAESLWNEMVSKGCEFDNTVYNVRLMNAAKESPERVKELMEEMSSVGLKPDTVSYNYLMTAYCVKGMMGEAKKVYEGLEKEHDCVPNAATFRTLVFHLCINGLYDQGLTVFKKSAVVHKIPDFKTCKHLTEGLVKNNRMEDARGVARTVKKKFPPRLVTEWKKLEEKLGLYSKASAASSSSQTREVFDQEREDAA
ncbi:PREDICTED: pentatricopeptide repeat-containing protein At2g18520, mitochondrial [Camelina sativa]|uniref:Pentatricopeptide repeat-containing protein At2g18520, mitochondrial n=1 Tax=Camelina sativa TaxID=90675 RepID=A0ABM0W9L0_CAMSA|nr:PREDICTED: pentatricopeptide repeat-containing protein At2g18520, mitochondrial [Camelina sativa]